MRRIWMRDRTRWRLASGHAISWSPMPISTIRHWPARWRRQRARRCWLRRCRAGRSAVMRKLAEAGEVGGGEGVDAGFAPDGWLPDGAAVQGDGWQLTALHTRGTWATIFASPRMMRFSPAIWSWAGQARWSRPPDGDLGDFMASLRALETNRMAGVPSRPWRPGGGTLDAARRSARAPRARETAILAALCRRPGHASELARRIYTDTPPELLPAATRNVLAHLIDLAGKDRVSNRLAG